MRLAAGCAALLVSCATGPRLQLGPGESVPDGEAVVTGRIEVFDGPKQVVGAPGRAEPSVGWRAFYVAVAADGEGVTRSQRLTDGVIRWHLPAGRYGIWGFVHVHKIGRVVGPLGATFDVPEGASSVNVGTLRLRFRREGIETRGSIHRSTAFGVIPFLTSALAARQLPELLSPLSLEVVDDLGAAAADAERLPARGTAPARSPMRLVSEGERLDPSLTAMDVKDRDYAEGFYVRFRVVRPVAPATVVQEGAWHAVESLEPTLEWRCPSGAVPAGLTYDLRISRVISTAGSTEGVPRYAGGSWTFGPVEYYRTALPEPRHRVETPLAPSSYYYWEVRLRRGNVVGPWSAYDLVPAGPTPEPVGVPDRKLDRELALGSPLVWERGAFAFRTPGQ